MRNKDLDSNVLYVYRSSFYGIFPVMVIDNIVAYIIMLIDHTPNKHNRTTNFSDE